LQILTSEGEEKRRVGMGNAVGEREWERGLGNLVEYAP